MMFQEGSRQNNFQLSENFGRIATRLETSVQRLSTIVQSKEQSDEVFGGEITI